MALRPPRLTRCAGTPDMALTATNRGSGTNNSANTSWTVTPGSNFTAGALGVLCVAADNGASGGSTNDLGATLTDSLGNIWYKRQAPLFDNGAASAGVQGAIYTSNLSAGAPTTSTTITVTTGASATAKTWTLTEWTAAAGSQAVYLTGGTATGATTTAGGAYNVTTGTIEVGDGVTCTVAMEAGTTQTLTGDSDTTNGSWSTQQYNEIGSTTSGSAIGSQSKVQTTTASTQGYNPVTTLACDAVGAWISVREVPIKKLATAGVG